VERFKNGSDVNEFEALTLTQHEQESSESITVDIGY